MQQPQRSPPAQHEPDEALLDSMSTPLGAVWIAVTDRGVAAIGLGELWSEDRLRADLARRGLLHASGAPAVMTRAKQQLKQYVLGDRQRFDLPLDLRGMPEFTASVLALLQQVPFGEVVTYGTLARRLAKPGASRAVGQANGRNPIPVVIPCHRVVATNGLGGFSCGLDIKRWLLAHEGRQDLLGDGAKD